MKKLGKYEGIVRLFLLLIVLPIAVYQLSLRSTVGLWIEVCRSERRIAESRTDSVSLSAAGTVHSIVPDTTDRIAGGGLLDSLRRFQADGKIAVVRYTPYLTRDGNDFALRTAEIVLSGTFSPLLKTLDRLERSLPDGRFLSTEFKTVRRGRQSSLQLTILVQQLTDKP